MFGPRIQQYARRIAEMVVAPLAAIGMTPNIATLLGLLLNAIAAAIIASGNLLLGGIVLLLAGLFDLVDGALARVRNQKTTFGAFLDSTLDRYSEGIVLLGVILFALSLHASAERTWIVVLAYVAALSSLMVSYARARAEGLGMALKSGLMARPERVLVLVIGLVIGSPIFGGETSLFWTLAFLAVTSTFTAVQRIILVWLKLRSESVGARTQQDQQAQATKNDSATVDQSEAQRTSVSSVAQPAIVGRLMPRRFRSTASDASETVISHRSRPR